MQDNFGSGRNGSDWESSRFRSLFETMDEPFN